MEPAQNIDELLSQLYSQTATLCGRQFLDKLPSILCNILSLELVQIEAFSLKDCSLKNKPLASSSDHVQLKVSEELWRTSSEICLVNQEALHLASSSFPSSPPCRLILVHQHTSDKNQCFGLIGFTTKPLVDTIELRNVLSRLFARWIDTFLFMESIEDFKNQIADLERTKEELVEVKNEALSVDRMKSLFVGKVSHELRTPMNGVLGMMELALEKNLDEDARAEIEMAFSSAQSLLHLLDDLLNFSRIEAGVLSCKNSFFHLGDFLRGIELLMRSSFAKRYDDLAFVVSLPENHDFELFGDCDKIRQIIINLVSNAFKFAHENGAVLLCIELREVNAEEVRLWFGVSDAGIGIPPSEMNRIFSPFEQVDDSFTRRASGTGLGLAIASELIQLLEGDMKLESQLGIGTRFEVVLPIKRAEAVKTENPTKTRKEQEELLPERAAPGREVVVLIADDNEINLRLLSKILEKEGCTITVARDGVKALEKSKQKKFDIMFFDIQMPGLDGVDLLHHIRSDHDNLNIDTPAVAVTANATKEDREKYLDFGMDSYVPKPINRSELVKVLHRYTREAPDLD